MRVFVTGATGFVGSAVVRELQDAGHQVVGLARSDAAAEALRAVGVEVRRGDLTAPEGLAAAARDSDGVLHLAFIHDFSKYEDNAQIDRRAVEAMLGALEGSGKPFVLTSGTGAIAPGRLATEQDAPPRDGPFSARLGTEFVVLDAAERGVRAMVIRLPQVHGAGDHGFIPQLIAGARRGGVAGYLGDGANRWPAVHRFDAARLYRLALENGKPGAVLHAIGDEGVSHRAMAEVIGEGLGVPVRSLAPEALAANLGWLAAFAGLDAPASSAITRRTLGWTPEGPDLLTDMRTTDYFA